MSKPRKEDTSPATKRDIAAILKRFDGIAKQLETVDRRFDASNKRLDTIDERFHAIDRRFAAMERQLDDRFDAIDRRFDSVDQQFNKVLECIGAEGKEARLHAEKLAEETRRHIDASDKNLRDYVKSMFDQKTFLYGEKFREHDRRVRVLERGQRTKAVA